MELKGIKKRFRRALAKKYSKDLETKVFESLSSEDQDKLIHLTSHRITNLELNQILTSYKGVNDKLKDIPNLESLMQINLCIQIIRLMTLLGLFTAIIIVKSRMVCLINMNPYLMETL